MNSNCRFFTLARSSLIAFFWLVGFNVSASGLSVISDFEDDDSGAWEIHTWGGEADKAISHQNCASGSGCLQFRVLSQPDQVVLRQNIETRQGASYQASVWLRAESEAEVTVRLRKNDPPYTVWGQRTLKAGATWQELSFQAAAGDSSSARFEFSMTDTRVAVYIDNVSLTETRTALFGAPDSYRTIEESFFGMHLNKGHVLEEWAPVSSVNVGTIRLWDTGTDWAGVEEERGDFDWTRLQLYLDRAQKYLPNARILYTFGRVPAWANGGNDIAVPPRDINDWKRFVTELVTRFGGEIDDYEIWNEFDYEGFWNGTPEQLLALHQAAFDIIRARDPGARILLPSITSEGLDKLEKYLRLRGADYADAAAIHVYSYEDELENSFAFVTATRDLLASYGHEEMPLFNTEGSVILRTPDVDEDTQAAAVSKYFILSALSGVINSNWYFWENTPDTERVELVNDFQYYNQITAAGRAYRETAKWLVTARITGYSKDPANGLHRVEIGRTGGVAGMIVWSDAGTQAFVPPADVKMAFLRRLDGTKSLYNGQPIMVGAEPVLLEYYSAPRAPVLQLLGNVSTLAARTVLF